MMRDGCGVHAHAQALPSIAPRSTAHGFDVFGVDVVGVDVFDVVGALWHQRGSNAQ